MLTPIGALNICSLVLGIVAWALAGMAMVSKRDKIPYGLSVSSFSLCMIALILQLFVIAGRLAQRDIAGLDDTMGAVIFAAVVLVVVTVVLNAVTVIKRRWCK